MKINTKTLLKTLVGDSFKDSINPGNKDLTVGVALANILTYHKAEGKMKLNILAKDFFTKASVEIDNADLTLIKEAVKKTEIYTNNILLGDLETILENVKEEKTK